jgi:transposase-like protein
MKEDEMVSKEFLDAIKPLDVKDAFTDITKLPYEVDGAIVTNILSTCPCCGEDNFCGKKVKCNRNDLFRRKCANCNATWETEEKEEKNET